MSSRTGSTARAREAVSRMPQILIYEYLHDVPGLERRTGSAKGSMRMSASRAKPPASTSPARRVSSCSLPACGDACSPQRHPSVGSDSLHCRKLVPVASRTGHSCTLLPSKLCAAAELSHSNVPSARRPFQLDRLSSSQEAASKPPAQDHHDAGHMPGRNSAL